MNFLYFVKNCHDPCSNDLANLYYKTDLGNLSYLQSLPVKKGFVRGISYITGYWIMPTNGNVNKPGSQLFYVTQSDPKGKISICAASG